MMHFDFHSLTEEAAPERTVLRNSFEPVFDIRRPENVGVYFAASVTHFFTKLFFAAP